jgi:L-lysine exporter family protein LysE/ArgO
LSPVIGSFLAGLALQASLIVAIGPQNAFVLRQGLRREHAAAVVALCASADIGLMTAGVAGMGAFVRARPGLLGAATWGGVAFLAAYGLRGLHRAFQPGALIVTGPGRLFSRAGVLAQAAAFTFLNPHVYLDTVLLVGTLGAGQPEGGATWFLLGASAASVAWFIALGLGARLLAPWLARPAAWRLLDLATGLTMCALAARLAVSGAIRSP